MPNSPAILAVGRIFTRFVEATEFRLRPSRLRERPVTKISGCLPFTKRFLESPVEK